MGVKPKKQHKNHVIKVVFISCISLVSFFIFATSTKLGRKIFSSNVEGYNNTFYVSRNGNNTDGKTWSSAWNELSTINWSDVQPGDRIVIDGGPIPCVSAYDFLSHSTNRPGLQCGMQYQTTLTIPKSGQKNVPITIQLAQDSGHNGTVVIFGGRTSLLPYCKQSNYVASGSSRSYGINLGGNSYISIDGIKRSGIMVYGAQMGVSLVSDNASFITLRNMEIFDNGTISNGGTDNPGVGFAGHDLTFERLLVHDNGQDEFQDQATSGDSHAKLSNLTIRDSWLYNRRENPVAPGWPFNSASGEACTHVDGVQIWAGGKDQSGFTVENTVFGPLLGQGFYPGDANITGFDNVTIKNSLFINARAQNINSDSGNNTSGWNLQNITSFEAGNSSVPGTIDITGTGHTITNSIFVGGYASVQGVTGSGNIYYNTDPIASATNTNPQFVTTLPSSVDASYAQLKDLDLTPHCANCSGKGSSIASISMLLMHIDQLNNAPLPTETQPNNPTPTQSVLPTVKPTTTIPLVLFPTQKPAPTPSIFPTPIVSGTSVTFEAESGTITYPFKISSGSIKYIYQTQDRSETTPSRGGRAEYTLNSPAAGNYTISMTISSPNDSANSVWVNIDAEPTDPKMVWDILPYTSKNSFAQRTVSWRGNGTFEANQFNPKVFYLTKGEHKLIIRGRESGVLIDKITIRPQ